MTSSRRNNSWDDVMERVNKAIPAANHGSKTPSGTPIDPPVVKNANIYARIADNLIHVNNMLTGEKAEEYSNPRTMFQNISKRWFDCADADVAIMMAEPIMMAELKIERIKHDRTKEDPYLDAIAYLVTALAFMQEGRQNDQR